MALNQLNFNGQNAIQVAIARLRQFEPAEGYYLAFSGGKDSQVVYYLASEAGVRFQAYYNLALEPPELRLFLRQLYPDVSVERQLGFNFWDKIVSNGFPTRQHRWCCEYMKEWGGAGRVVLTGVRWAESTSRKKHRQLVDRPGKSRLAREPKVCVNPIIDWSTKEVWAYLESRSAPYCSLYDEGSTGRYKGDGNFRRLGCVLCPMENTRQTRRDFVRWPKIADAWFRAFQRLYDRRKAEGAESIKRWSSAEDMFTWWLRRKNEGETPANQYCFVFE
jgi:phosphoadenosine phosphosulfate reductase